MAVSNTADLFFQLWNTFLILSIIVGAVVFGVLSFLLLKYRARAGTPEPEDAPVLGRLPQHRGHLRTLLASVTLTTIILALLIFGTFSVIDQTSSIPDQCNAVGAYNVPNGPCMWVNVVGQRFYWTFYYANGTTVQTAGHPNLVVPTGKYVVLNVTSDDVVHNLTLIEYKIKTDAIPGRANRIWFNANDPGTFRIQCFELCGTGHYTMITHLIAMPPAPFDLWFSKNSTKNGT
jgi:cytochrome c oxidase subunit 2